MINTYIIDDSAYTFIPGTAIPSCDLDTGDRRDALLVVTVYNGERFEYLFFDYGLPATAAEAEDILSDKDARELDTDSIATFESPIDWQSWDWTGGELAGL